MVRQVKARYSKGVFEPLEEVEMEEGKEYLLAVKESPSVEEILDALKETAGAWKDSHDSEVLKSNIYADRLVATRSKPRL